MYFQNHIIGVRIKERDCVEAYPFFCALYFPKLLHLKGFKAVLSTPQNVYILAYQTQSRNAIRNIKRNAHNLCVYAF